MTFFMMLAVLAVGLVLLISGFVAKKKWLKIVSIVPLAIASYQLVLLFSLFH